MLADLIRRVLEFEGLRVTQVMNITDVGHMTDESSPEAVDKMLLAMEDEGLSPTRSPRSTRRRSSTTPTLLGIRPADRYPKATEHIPEMIDDHADAPRQGPRLRGRTRAASTTTSRRSPATASSRATRWTTCARATAELETDPSKRHARGLRAVEGRGARPAHEVGLALGRGLPGLARGVLGDVDEVPRRPLRHPHRRHGPAVPPPRGRDRAVRGRGGPSRRGHLGPRGPSAAGRAEDLEVHRQRRARPRAGGARDGPAELPLAHVPDPLPQRDGLQLGRHGRRRPPREATPPAHGDVGAGPRHGAPSWATPRRRSTTGCGRRSPTTWACRRRSSS